MGYGCTLNLTQSPFSMKAQLSQKEPLIIKYWKKRRALETSSGRPLFVLHDGPPYANGHIHIGHALNKILKDMILKYKTLQGYQTPYVMGWDCHGLPIEHEVSKISDHLSDYELRKECACYAKKFVKIQQKDFERLGIDTSSPPYLTLTPFYQSYIVSTFMELYRSDSVVQGAKPIHWCLSCRTSLAEAEIEYSSHTSPSITVLFQLHLPDVLISQWSLSSSEPVHIAIWTTTPWTLPSNMAIACHPRMIYQVVRFPFEGRSILVLLQKDRVQPLLQSLGIDQFDIVVSNINGVDLDGISYSHPFMWDITSPQKIDTTLHSAYQNENDFLLNPFFLKDKGQQKRTLVLADFVSNSDGTGAVHIAPGHGQDDFHCVSDSFLHFMPVDSQGVFTSEVPDFIAGCSIHQASDRIIDLLRQKKALIGYSDIQHSYPHCWRCHQALIMRLKKQWFVSVSSSSAQKKALNLIQQTKWTPSWGQERLSQMIQNRPDWCISRQRSWGVPIPELICQSCSLSSLSPTYKEHTLSFLQSVCQLFRKVGSDIWFSDQLSQHLNYQCPRCQSSQWTAQKDILDVWFDSGSSFYSVLKNLPALSFPADLYLEGSDQHRGWFQSSLWLSALTQNKAPFRHVLTHGFVVDNDNRKMSKSIGNVISPHEIIDQFGADVVRLFVFTVNYTNDVRLSDEIIEQKVDAYRKIRNTFRFCLNNLSDFSIDSNQLSYKELLSIDQYALHLLSQLILASTSLCDDYAFYRFFQTFHHFLSVDMSAFYFDGLKDRLYTYGIDSTERRSAQTTLYWITSVCSRLLAPFLSFTAEEIWQVLQTKKWNLSPDHSSVFESPWPQPQPEWHNPSLFNHFSTLLKIREKVFLKIAHLRDQGLIGRSYEATVTLQFPPTFEAMLKKNQTILPELFSVSEVIIIENSTLDAIDFSVSPCSHKKCERCWMLVSSVGVTPSFPDLCQRCFQLVSATSSP